MSDGINQNTLFSNNVKFPLICIYRCLSEVLNFGFSRAFKYMRTYSPSLCICIEFSSSLYTYISAHLYIMAIYAHMCFHKFYRCIYTSLHHTYTYALYAFIEKSTFFACSVRDINFNVYIALPC